jgi:hypothetical protein
MKFELAALPESLLRADGENKVVERVGVLKLDAATGRQMLFQLLYLYTSHHYIITKCYQI